MGAADGERFAGADGAVAGEGVKCMAKERIPEEERSRQLQYYYDHREERLAYGSEYAAKHKEAMAAKSRKYRQSNREKTIAYQNGYYRAHREARIAYQKEYYRAHKVEHQAYNRAWYAKKKAAAGEASSGDGMGNMNKAIIAEKEGNVK